MLHTSICTFLSVQLPIVIHSSTNRHKLFDVSAMSSPLSLSLIVRGAAAIVDGFIIHLDTEKISIHQQKQIDVFASGRNRDSIKTYCVGKKREIHVLVHARKRPVY